MISGLVEPSSTRHSSQLVKVCARTEAIASSSMCRGGSWTGVSTEISGPVGGGVAALGGGRSPAAVRLAASGGACGSMITGSTQIARATDRGRRAP